MHPIFWLLIAGLVAIVVWLVVPHPQPPSQPEAATQLLARLEEGHWLIGAGSFSASVQLSHSGPEGQPTTKNVVVISTATQGFQGMIAASLEGERWLRRGEELYRLLPGESEVTQVDDLAARRASFLGSALSVEEFLIGFRFERYAPSAVSLEGGRESHVTLLAKDYPNTPYARLEVELDAQGRPTRLESYNSQGMPLKTVEILSYADVQGKPLIERLLASDLQGGTRTDVWMKERKVHALPEFAFTPETLKSLQIQPPK